MTQTSGNTNQARSPDSPPVWHSSQIIDVDHHVCYMCLLHIIAYIIRLNSACAQPALRLCSNTEYCLQTALHSYDASRLHSSPDCTF